MKRKSAAENSEVMRLIVGLGNPGARYAHTYHNAGAEVLRAMITRSSGRPPRFTARPTFSYQKIGRTVFAKPRTFMNQSGRAVKDALLYFRIPPERLLVVHDDADLPLGDWKLSRGRGAAGHRGVESIFRELGTDSCARARIGIRKKPGKAGGFVLDRMPATDREKLHSVFGAVIRKLMENETA
jgi:PTH1 family peptidyl-tRNA hydrolase